MKKTILISFGLTVTALQGLAATVLLNVGDAGWSPAALAYTATAATDVISSSNTVNGVMVTASSTGGGLENHHSGTWGIGSSLSTGFAEAEISSSDTLTFTFGQAMTFTSVQTNFWDGNTVSYTINGTTYTGAGANGATLASATTDSFTTISFSTTSTANGTFSNITFETVPEPSSTALLGLGCLALVLRRRQ